MSLKVIKAVYDSHLERTYRPLAVALAFFADDTGARVFPGADTLIEALGVRESAVRHHLGALKVRGIIVPVGTRGGHTREFRFDLDRLKSYRPIVVEKVRKPRKNGPPTLHAGATTAATRQTPATLHAGASKPAPPCHQPCTPVPPTLHVGAISDVASLNDRQDHQDRQDLTAAGAAGHADAEKTKTSETAVVDIDALIAARALDAATHDRNERPTNLAKHLRRICAEHHVAYDAERLGSALDQARRVRDERARAGLDEARAQHRRLTPLPTRRRRVERRPS